MNYGLNDPVLDSGPSKVSECVRARMFAQLYGCICVHRLVVVSARTVAPRQVALIALTEGYLSRRP